ncbi:MAG: N,N-dimethylformamidase beta subunit family domain-containing protein, partial [Myxococcota bacterium]
MAPWLIGHVSDEWDAALADVLVEMVPADGSPPVATRSRASGAVWADLPAGRCEVILARTGYGSKRSSVTCDPAHPLRLRLLSDGLLGYVWPKCATAGAMAELRIHADAPYELSLWRYGWERECVADLGRFDPYSPDGLRQVLPDGDIAAVGVQWGDDELTADPRHFVAAPQRSGLYYWHLQALDGRFTSFPWVVAPAQPRERVAVLASNITWNAYNDFGGRSNYLAPDRLPPTPSVFTKHEEVWFSHPERPPWRGQDCGPLSFDRPEPLNVTEPEDAITDPIRRRGGEHVAPAEWRLLGWLEREGFAHDLYG